MSKNTISRRLFVQGLATTSIATLAAPNLLFGRFSSNGENILEDPNVIFSRSPLPVLRNGDVIILGGSFPAIAAALEFARSGKRVVLVETRTYMGREVQRH